MCISVITKENWRSNYQAIRKRYIQPSLYSAVALA